MNAQPKLVVAYENLSKAEVALAALEKARFTRDNVSLIRNGDTSSLDENRDDNVYDSDHVADDNVDGGSSAAAGAGAGAVAAAPFAVATMIGPLLIAGPLAGALTGAAVGGFFGMLSEYGDGERSVAELRRLVDGGAVLIVIEDDLTRIMDAEQICQTCDPEAVVRFEPPNS